LWTPRALQRIVAAIALAAAGQGLRAAIAYDNDAATWDVTPGSASWTSPGFTVGAGPNQILYLVIDYESAFTATPSFNGAPLSLVRSDSAGSNNFQSVYFLISPATTSSTFTVNFGAAITNPINITAFSYSGVNQGTPLGANGAVTGGPAGPPWSLSLAINPTNASSMILELSDVEVASCLPNSLSWTQGNARYSQDDMLTGDQGLGIADWAPGFSGAPFSFNPSFGGPCSGGSNMVVQAVEMLPVLAATTVSCVCAPAPPVIDGNLNDAVWSSASFTPMSACDSGSGTCPSLPGETAQFASAYDATALYVAVNVNDPSISKSGIGGGLFQCSAVELFLDFNNIKSNCNCGGNYPQANQYQWILVYDCSAVQEYHNPVARVISYASVLTASGYNMEIRLPWANLGLAAPAPGFVSGFDVAVDYPDGTASRKHQVMNWGVNSNGDWTTNPSVWGNIQYGACASPTPSDTPSVTATLTPSPTLTISNTFSQTVTLTPSPTASLSPTPSLTLTNSPSLTATTSRTPSATPTISATFTPCPTPVGPTVFYLHLYPNNPNPAGGNGTYFVYFLDEAATVTIDVYTVAGELVQTMAPFPGQYGANEEFWDLTNKTGKKVANGVFIYRVKAVTYDGKSASDFSKCAVSR
jgi:hypothetical protein